ncbi:hypothetical protein G9409_04365 [Chlorobium sp. BLA1]|uniref:hypothetical protein n=1 Tax=Candidatus Chlorobium masyuteum TaxID=2716876 RepID=UPI00141FDE13|nr:hypothetical protein [Candidatus Chlorobium masyuteum]NHQ59827.1 hypothetical protein [Candidatus Chlorobium masyuteum]
MSWGVENEQKRKDIKELLDVSERIMRANPNHVNEVAKSDSGCWMEQIYGMQRHDFCDLAPDCPIRREQEWQNYLKENNIVIEKKPD